MGDPLYYEHMQERHRRWSSLIGALEGRLKDYSGDWQQERSELLEKRLREVILEVDSAFSEYVEFS